MLKLKVLERSILTSYIPSGILIDKEAGRPDERM